VKVKASANRETGRREERKKRDEGRKEFARWRNASKKRWKEKWLSFIVKKKKTTNHFFPLGTRFGIMAGIVIAIGDRDDDDSREIKMGVAESAPLSKNDEGDADRFALREEWLLFGNSGTR